MSDNRRFRDVLVADLRRPQNKYPLERLRTITDVAMLWRELANVGLVRRTCVSLNFVYYVRVKFLFRRFVNVPLRLVYYLIL